MKVLVTVVGYGESERPGISGGDIRWLKFVQWLGRRGHEVTVLGPRQCGDFLEKYGCRLSFISVGRMGGLGIAGAVRRVAASIWQGLRLRAEYDMLFSVTSVAYDVATPLLLRWRSPRSSWVVTCHWVAPLAGRNTGRIAAWGLFLLDRVGLFLSRWADVILCVSQPTLAKVMGFPFLRRERLIETGCGVERPQAPVPLLEARPIAAIHIKRVAASKGSFDLPEIWAKVRQAVPEAVLTMCGDGSSPEVARLKELIRASDGGASIRYLGPVYDARERDRLLQNSRIFLLPSYEENWAIVIGEALEMGLEVVCYDLPDIRPVWGGRIHWVPLGDKVAFADCVIELLRGSWTRLNLPSESRSMTWDDVFEQEWRAMSTLISADARTDSELET